MTILSPPSGGPLSRPPRDKHNKSCEEVPQKMKGTEEEEKTTLLLGMVPCLQLVLRLIKQLIQIIRIIDYLDLDKLQKSNNECSSRGLDGGGGAGEGGGGKKYSALRR